MRSRISSLISPLVFSFLPLLAPGAQAQHTGMYVDISPCMGIEDDAKRYTCYDQILQSENQTRQDLTETLPPDNAKQDDATEGNAVVEQFGKQSPAISRQQQANAKVLENDDGSQELLDTITQLKERTPNQWLITLSSGQVWMQVNSKRYRLQEGMEVRIYPSPFGSSFRLSTTDHNGFIQVQRIQ